VVRTVLQVVRREPGVAFPQSQQRFPGRDQARASRRPDAIAARARWIVSGTCQCLPCGRTQTQLITTTIANSV
jgi:hypothetical protein